jgi:hypothetical protein
VSESELKVTPNGTNAFGMPLLDFPKIALPGVTGELAAQGYARAREGYEKIKAASEEMTEALRETYSSSARSTTTMGSRCSKSQTPMPPLRSITSSISSAASQRPMSIPCLRRKRARRSTPHPTRIRNCGRLPRSLRRKRVSRSGSASPRFSTKPARRTALNHVQGSFEEGSGRLE